MKCSKCNGTYTEEDYTRFGFVTANKFRTHNSRNKNCPFKQKKYPGGGTSGECNSKKTPQPWEPPKKNTELITVDDWVHEQEQIQHDINYHKRGGRPLWFDTTEDAASDLLEGILDQNINVITLVAEPGSGKTMVTHLLTQKIAYLPYEQSISPESITITTGMSDTEWEAQYLNNFKLRGCKNIFKPLSNIGENHCITHRSNFHKRISYLLNNQQYINNHIFIVDESHIAEGVEMTIDKELDRMGLTIERMKEYGITIILISATPDVNLSLFKDNDCHKLVQLKNGVGYKGFKHYTINNMIKDYIKEIDSKQINIINYIHTNWSTPRYHYIRARTQQDKGEYITSIKNVAIQLNYEIVCDDSEHDIYLSFENDDNEKLAYEKGKKVIKTYESPDKHTIILIKNKYNASKRLKLTPYAGLISEKPSNVRNTTITCNSLIPRFWSYDPIIQYINDEKPIFLCDSKSVNEYNDFCKDFKYKGKDYTGKKIKSSKKKTKETGNTTYGQRTNITPKIHDSTIKISAPFKSTEGIHTYLLHTCKFSEEGIRVHEVQFTDEHRGNCGYMYPKRNVPGHNRNNPGDTFITEKDYNDKFVNKGQGSNINRQGTGASGQCFMIYPVYKDDKSLPEDVIYYVHSLIMANKE